MDRGRQTDLPSPHSIIPPALLPLKHTHTTSNKTTPTISFSYEAFTHVRGVLSRWDHWLGDLPSAVRYAPYTPLKHRVSVLLVSDVNARG